MKVQQTGLIISVVPQGSRTGLRCGRCKSPAFQETAHVGSDSRNVRASTWPVNDGWDRAVLKIPADRKCGGGGGGPG